MLFLQIVVKIRQMNYFIKYENHHQIYIHVFHEIISYLNIAVSYIM